MKKIKFITLSMLFAATAVFAQEETSTAAPAPAKPVGLTVSGSVDAYHKSNLTASNDDMQSFGVTPATAVPGHPAFKPYYNSFANQTGFALGMANVILGYEGAKTGFVADLVAGPRGNEATFNTDNNIGIVNQAYVFWKVSEKVKLTMGRWNTFVGYEVISPTVNFNYSVSYLFSNGPFSHMGAKANIALSDDWSLMLAVTNPYDINDVSDTGEVAYGAQLGYKGQYLNVYYDSGHFGGLGLLLDYTGGFNVTDEFYLGINGAYVKRSTNNPFDPNYNDGYAGLALYPKYAVSDSFSLGLRGEYFSRYQEKTWNAAAVLSTTLTGSYTIENLTIKPEIRLDSWEGGVKPYADVKGNPSESLAAFTLAAIYAF